MWGIKISHKYMPFKPTYTPVYFPPTTRRPTKYPSFKPTNIVTTIPSSINTIAEGCQSLQPAYVIPNIPKAVSPHSLPMTILSTTQNNKLSQSNIIIIVSCSVFFTLCIMVIIYIIYDKRDKMRREKEFHHWLTQKADIRIA